MTERGLTFLCVAAFCASIIASTFVVIILSAANQEKMNEPAYVVHATNGDIITSGPCPDGYFIATKETMINIDGTKEVHNICKNINRNAVLQTNGTAVPHIQWRTPTEVSAGSLWRVTPEGNWENVTDLYELKKGPQK